MIQILAVGKKHESWVEEGIARYERRLKRPFNVEWALLPHSSLDNESARREESSRILSRLDRSDFVIVLDERGTEVDSLVLSKTLLAPLERSTRVVVIIGGAYGVDDTVRERANVVWSLSLLVFPHQLVRLMLIEQVYRAQEIAGGGSYHHV